MMDQKNELQNTIKRQDVRKGLQKPVQELHDVLYQRVQRGSRRDDAVKMTDAEKKLDQHFNVNIKIDVDSYVLPGGSAFKKIET